MRVFILGGTGFIGSRIIERVLEDGHQVVALARDPAALARFGSGVSVVKGDIASPITYRGQALHCQASINCVGLIRQKWYNRRQTYARAVVRGTEAWLKECHESNVKHVVLFSANAADPEGPPYSRTKWLAEQAVRNSGLPWTILRPSFVVGPGGIVEEFARLMKLRILPYFGKQDYYAEPVDREDVVATVVGSLTNPKAKSRVFHLGGPDQVTYEQMVKTVRAHTGTRCWMPRLPKWAGYALAGTLGWVPGFPATVENLKLLFRGNVTPERDYEGLFGIRPKPFEAAVRDAVQGLRTKP